MSFPVPPVQILKGNIRRTFVAEKIQAFVYNFTSDGGLVGTYGTGITIPPLAIFKEVTFRIITPIIGAAGANIQIGWAGSLGALDTENAPINSNILYTFSGGISSSVGFPILFTIDTAPLTGGKCVIAISYIDEPVN